MGFRSTFTTMDYSIRWPEWFQEKYKETIFVRVMGSLHPKHEGKAYGAWIDLPEDIQKAIDWKEWNKTRSAPFRFVLVYLHECGGITRVCIEEDKITWSEPLEWEESKNEISHGYQCVGTCNQPVPQPK